MCACQQPYTNEPVKLLLQHGADVRLRTPATTMTALHVAARRGYKDKCKLLIEADESTLELRSCDGKTPIFDAVVAGHLPVVELLHKSYNADIFTVDDDGLTLLHGAVLAETSSQPLLAYLLRNGLSVNAVNKATRTPLHAAVDKGNAAAVQILLEHGAAQGGVDLVELLPDSSVQATAAADGEGLTLLMRAAAHGHTEVAQLLMLRGANVLGVNAACLTALHYAAYNGKSETLRLLLQHGADMNVSDKHGLTPLIGTAIYGNLQCMQLLLDAGADVSRASSLGITVLHTAASDQNCPQLLKILLQRADAMALINSTAKHCECCGNCSPLAWCSQPAHVKLLLAAGADMHVTSSTGNTCLHVAAAHNRLASVVCLLIKAGVNLPAVNSDGKTAAQVATDCGNTLTASLLTRAAVGP
jgi:ankyrin repeat protein